MLFIDLTVRKVGLKQLRIFKWNREYDLNVCPWTKAGGVWPTDWPEWMINFKEF